MDAAGTLYVADTGNNAVRRIAPDGTVSTVAGDGTAGYRDGPGAQARFNGPVGVAVDAGGRVLVADTYNDRIRAIAPDGAVVTLAGGAQSGAADGDAAGAQFNTPCGVAVDSAGTIYVADTGNGLIRFISPDGTVGTIHSRSAVCRRHSPVCRCPFQSAAGRRRDRGSPASPDGDRGQRDTRTSMSRMRPAASSRHRWTAMHGRSRARVPGSRTAAAPTPGSAGSAASRSPHPDA